MNSCLCFLDDKISESVINSRVVKGFHGLHQYANEFWFQHLLQYAKYEYAVEDEDLEEPLEEMEEFFWKEEPGTGARRLKLDDKTSANNIENQLQVLKDLPQAQRVGRDILTFRRFLSQEKYSHTEPECKQASKPHLTLISAHRITVMQSEELRLDPTRFSEVSQRNQTIVNSLMQSSADSLLPGVELEEVEEFKRVYTSSAFTCRFFECPRYSDGFPSSVDRDMHEKIHTEPLRCADLSCNFYARGFTTTAGLLKHNRKYHPSPNELSFPRPETENVDRDKSVTFHDSGYGSHVPPDASDSAIRKTPFDMEDLPFTEVSDKEPWDSDIRSVASFTDDINSQVSTKRSPQEVAAEEQLGSLLAQNEELRGLYETALSKISKERLIQNLRRLLKQYHLDLCKIASTNLEKATVHLLRSRWSRVRIAQMISDLVQPDNGEDPEQPLAEVPRNLFDLEAWIAGNAGFATPKTRVPFDPVLEEWNGAELADEESWALQEDDSLDESDEENNPSAKLMPKISEAENFLLEGESFQRLLTTFRTFLMPASLSHLTRVLMSLPSDRIWFSDMDDNTIVNKFKILVEDLTVEDWQWWPLRPKMRKLQMDQTRVHWLCVRGYPF